MSQPRGKTGNPYGRPKGSKNKQTSEIKDKIEKALLAKTDKIMKDFDSLKGERRIKFFIELAKIVLPRPRSQEEEEENERRNNDLLERLFPRRD